VAARIEEAKATRTHTHTHMRARAHTHTHTHTHARTHSHARTRRLEAEIEAAEDAGDEAKADGLRTTRHAELVKKLRDVQRKAVEGRRDGNGNGRK
jgi:hypothetical protein